MLPHQASNGAGGLVVSTRGTVESKEVEQIALIEERRDCQELRVPAPRTHQAGVRFADREAVVETIQLNHVVQVGSVAGITAGATAKGPIQGQKAGLSASRREGAIYEIAAAQAGIEQILAGEAGLQVQAHVVVKDCGANISPVGISAIAASSSRSGSSSGSRSRIRTGSWEVVGLTATEGVGTDHEDGVALQFGGGGELGGLQLADALVETVNAALEHAEFLLEVVDQALQFVGHFGDAIETGVQQCSGLKAGHRLATFEGAVGITSYAAVALDQVAQRLIGPVGGLNF